MDDRTEQGKNKWVSNREDSIENQIERPIKDVEDEESGRKEISARFVDLRRRSPSPQIAQSGAKIQRSSADLKEDNGGMIGDTN